MQFGSSELPPLAALRTALGYGQILSPFKSRTECICEYWDAQIFAAGPSSSNFAEGMRCEVLSSGIYHIKFTHQVLMASTMMRSQERYECPSADLRGRAFSVSEYKAWEREQNQVQGFRYYEHWPGFNVPGEVVRAVSCSDSLLPQEQALMDLLEHAGAFKCRNFYVIGTCDEDDDSTCLYHEVCHALYEVDAKYREAVDAELDVIAEGLMCRMKGWLRCEGYANVSRILNDEVHAYLSEGDNLGCSPRETGPHCEKLRQIFAEFAGDLSHLLDSVTDDGSDCSSVSS